MAPRSLLLLAVALLAVTIVGPRSAVSVSDPVVSVDTDPTDNTATYVGTIDACREVAAGNTFQVDVTMQDVIDLAGFEAKLHYNPAVLQVTGVDYNYFLATAGSVTNWGEAPTSLNPDTDGTLSMVATLSIPLPATGASGEGVLARLTLEAVAEGGSVLDLGDVKLADINNNPIQPADGQGVYLGPVNDATISVGGSCSSADSDGDGIGDDVDNCLDVSNPNQEDADVDGMGDACDWDDDGDGYSDDTEILAGSDPLNLKCNNASNDDAGDDSKVNDGCPPVMTAESGAQCDNDTDDDGDGYVNDGCPLAGATKEGSTPEVCDDAGLDEDRDGSVNEGFDRDPVNGIPDCTDPDANTDGEWPPNPDDDDDDDDGFSDVRENHMATDSLDACPDDGTDDAWPADTTIDTAVNVLDLFRFISPTRHLGGYYGEPDYSRRFDTNADWGVNVLDLFALVPYLGASCTN